MLKNYLKLEGKKSSENIHFFFICFYKNGHGNVILSHQQFISAWITQKQVLLDVSSI